MLTTSLLRYRVDALVHQDPDPSQAPTRSRGETPAATDTGTTGTQQDGKVDGQGQPGGLESCLQGPNAIMLVGFVAIFYFLILRPQQKQEKQRREMLAAIQKGDRVVTTGGLHGIVEAIDDKSVVLRVDQVKMTFDRTAVGRVVRDEAGAGDGATK